MSDVDYVGHTLHFKPDSHFLIGQNEILLNVIKTMVLAADRGVITYSADSRQAVRYKIPISNETLSHLA